ncbi:MAG: tripartite tricarboxylate transporter substrate-binding protein [Burkholderiales bacterium]
MKRQLNSMRYDELRHCDWIPIAALVAALGAPCVSIAQTASTTRLLTGFVPGASGDAMARAIAEKMRGALGENVIVEAKPGAGGRIAMEQLKAAKPDGKTINLTSLTPLTAFPWLYAKLNYDAFNDFEPVAHVAQFKYVFAVSMDVKANNLAEFVALVKANNRFGFYSSPSQGGGAHMAAETFARAAGVNMSYVGYKGTANAITDMLGGQLPSMMGNAADFIELTNRGKLKVLGVANAERSRHLPQVPTFKEQGFDIEASGSFAMYVPAKTPAATIARLAKAITEGVVETDVKALGDRLGLEVTGLGPKELAAMQRKEYDWSGSRIKAFGFKAED